ncbi:MAG: hypothetical protein ACM3SY_06945 [Candidatus Omnitrophota bacterium]
MKNLKVPLLWVLLFVFLSGEAILGMGEGEFSKEKAQLIDLNLKRIARKNKAGVFMRKVTFSEDELNSYLNLIYIKRYTPEVTYVKLSLIKNNYVSGMIKIKLLGKKYEKIPAFLRDIELETSGKIECNRYRMRVLFDSIKVNGTKFSPEVLDEGFGAAQSASKVKKSMYDWFNFFPGIKNIIVDDKKVTIFY